MSDIAYEGTNEFGVPLPEDGYNTAVFSENLNFANDNSFGWNGGKTGSLDDSGVENFKENTLNSSNRRSFSKSHSPKYRSSIDDLMIGDVRLNRIAQAEAAIRQEMFKECTFRPEILPLPQSYGTMKGIDTPFHDRVSKWNKEKETEIKLKKRAVLLNETAECSFKPKINRKSEQVIREIRGSDEPTESANDRLYKSAALYNEQRYKLIEDEKLKEDHLERTTCTFKPELLSSRNKQYADVSPKVNRQTGPATPQTGARHNYHPTPAASTDLTKEHTFQPKVCQQ